MSSNIKKIGFSVIFVVAFLIFFYTPKDVHATKPSVPTECLVFFKVIDHVEKMDGRESLKNDCVKIDSFGMPTRSLKDECSTAPLKDQYFAKVKVIKIKKKKDRSKYAVCPWRKNEISHIAFDIADWQYDTPLQKNDYLEYNFLDDNSYISGTELVKIDYQENSGIFSRIINWILAIFGLDKTN